MKMKQTFLPLLLVAILSQAVQAQIRITEWMYNGLGFGNTGEFVELTNVGVAGIDMTGWSYDDDSRLPGTITLSAFGVVAAGESLLLTDLTVADFRTNWNLSPMVKVIGGNTANLGRNDEINIFDAAQNLVDRLTYGDQNFPGTIRTQNVSGIPISPAALGANDVAQWERTMSGVDGSITSLAGEVGNPGFFVIPEPAAMGMLTMLCVLLGCWRGSQL